MRLVRLPFAVALLLCALPAAAQYRRNYPLPAPGVPGSLGVNIHFYDPRPGEMEQLAAAGFKWIRVDFVWAGVERVRGQYEFGPYERLMAHLDKHKIRPIFILDYGNDLYQEGSPRTEESRAAFARFAAAAVTHFKGRGALWEMWNEPNISFWKPTPNVDEYIALALATGKAIRQAAPEEWYIGPGVSGMDFTFMEKCFRAGLLKVWDAVSFHPYRNTPPETAAQDFLRLRALVAQYAGGRDVPLINSEWGYSEKYPGLDLTKQSKYIARQALSNVASGLVVSIWYDWHDDGADPKEVEHHFGTVTPDYRPKPTYEAISTLTHTLSDCRYNKRLALASPTDYCLLFTSANGPRLAAWTTDPTPHTARIPASAGAFKAINYLGTESTLKADKKGLEITLTDAPQYLTPVGDNAVLAMAAHWGTLPQTVFIETPGDAYGALRNVLAGDWTAQDKAEFRDAGIEVNTPDARIERMLTPVITTPAFVRQPLFRELGALTSMAQVEKLQRDGSLRYRSETPCPIQITIYLKNGNPISQDLVLVGRHPLRILPQTAVGWQLPVRIENPTGAPFSGRVRLTDDAKGTETVPQTIKQGPNPLARLGFALPLDFKQGEKERTVLMPIMVKTDGSYSAGVSVETEFDNSHGWTVVSELPDVEYRPLERFASYTIGAPLPARDYRVLPDGDPKVKSTIGASIVAAPEDLPNAQGRAVRIDYNFDMGWKFLRLEPEGGKRAPLTGKPSAFGVWVYGDGSGDVLNARFTDATGQTFQPTAGRIDWRGWLFVTFSLRGENSGHWSGADDGKIHYPIHLDTLLLVDSPGGRGGKGTIYATGFTLMGR